MDNSNDFATGLMVGENRGGYGNGWGGGFGGEGLWLFAILALMGGGFGNWGGNRGGEVVTEATLCNANSFSELKGSVGRLSDQVANMYTGLQNGLCNLGYTILQNFNGLESQLASCCCSIERGLLENRYLAAQNTADINANTTSKVQSVLDAICGLRMEMKDDRNAQLLQRVNQLEMQQLMCGVVRYPNSTTFSAGYNPFGWNNGCNTCCGNGNI